ncbi:glycoside hydrolase family 25 protein [Paenibacillus sanfengchensis]|uniref:glycoside hydrolase family 25 protein n=1 Tax=Paenibacillus sanfengchensis TaxID=3119819 RepID=UPI002FE026F3
MQVKSNRNARGVDVSHWQGEVDWPQVKAAGISFAFIKATQGTAWVDPKFRGNAAGAHKAGLLTGPYHFVDAVSPEAARKQAQHFVRTLQGVGTPFTLPPVMDYENNPAGLSRPQINQIARAFLSEVERLIGIRPIIYTGNAFAQQFDETLQSYPLWIARYSSAAPYDVPAWKKWDFWQYSDSGRIAGIGGHVDLNVYRGSVEELKGAYAALNNPRQEEENDISKQERNIEQVSDWAAKDWAEAKACGIFDGERPGAPLTREEAAVAVNRLRQQILSALKQS